MLQRERRDERQEHGLPIIEKRRVGWSGEGGSAVITHANSLDSRRDRHPLRTHIKREHLGRHDPSERSPSDGKPSNVPVNHEDRTVTGSLVALVEPTAVDGNDGTDGSVRNGHVGFTESEHGPSTELSVSSEQNPFRTAELTLSTNKTAGMVMTKLTIPTTPVARRPMVDPVRPIWEKMVGA